MKSKTFIILLVICAVLGGIAYWQFNKEGRSQTAQNVEMGEELLGDLSANDIASIRISGPENSVILEKATVWEVENRFGYPADFSKIADLVKKLRSVTVGRSFSGTGDARSRLSLYPPDAEDVAEEAKGTRIVLANSAGESLSDILVGAPREASAGTGGHYLMLLPDTAVYLVDKSFRNMETQPEAWLVKELVDAAAADIREVRYKTAGGGETVYTLRRAEKGAAPAFQTRPQGFEGREAMPSTINALYGALSGFQIEDVADPAHQPAEASFAHVFEFRLFDGTGYAISLGDAVPGSEDRYYVNVRAGYVAPPEEETGSESGEAETEGGGDDIDAQKKAEEAKKKAEEDRRRKQAELKETALKLDERLRDWIYIIPEWRYDKFETDCDALFEELPAEAEAAEAAPDN